MLLPTTPYDQSGLDPMLCACHMLHYLIHDAARSNAFFACESRVWHPAAKSHVQSRRQISENI
jgi:hypothetical protein